MEKILLFWHFSAATKSKIADAVATFFDGETSSEILLGFGWLPDLLNKRRNLAKWIKGFDKKRGDTGFASPNNSHRRLNSTDMFKHR